jgi:hypothetical protein
VAEILRSGFEDTALWVFCFKYFESSVVFPFIVTRTPLPTWLNVVLKGTFWLILAASWYFTTAAELNEYHMIKDIWFKDSRTELPDLTSKYHRNTQIALCMKIVTGIVLAVAIGIMHFVVRKLGFSLKIKTKGFVLNLVLLVVYALSIIIFYLLLQQGNSINFT